MTSSQLMKGVGTGSLLYRILESPEQVSALQHLPPPTLARLIHHVGLEDSGEPGALATTQQLARIFDDDLWYSTRPGQEERFDAERFGLWLEVLLEMGADRLRRPGSRRWTRTSSRSRCPAWCSCWTWTRSS